MARRASPSLAFWVKNFRDPEQTSLPAGSLSLALGDTWIESVRDTSTCRWVNGDVSKEQTEE